MSSSKPARLRGGVDDRVDSIKNALDSVANVLTIGLSDLHAISLLKPPDEDLARIQFLRRSLVRHVGVLIESFSYALRQLAIDAVATGSLKVEAGALELLQERRYGLDKGKIVPILNIFNKAEENVFLGFRYAARACYDEEYDVDRGQRFWSVLKEFLPLRHRVTHPKGASDLEVSREESELAAEMATKLAEEGRKLIDRMTNSLANARRAEKERLRSAVKEMQDVIARATPLPETPK